MADVVERNASLSGSRPRWLQVVNDEPEQRPHTMILGPTRSGKTTLATAAMADRPGRAIVITPKLNPSNWRGAEIVTLDDDGSYAPITAALEEIEDEKRRRIRVLRAQGADALEPLTIVFDEIGELAAFEPRAPEAMTSLSSIGAELKMRLIGIGTSDEALGIKRWKATRNNYVRLETNADRKATLNDGVRQMPIATGDVVPRASVAQLRPWRAAAPTLVVAATGDTIPIGQPAPAPDPLLAELFASLPAEIRAAVPSLSPERAQRLERAMASYQAGSGEPQRVMIDREQGDVIVNVAQLASPVSRKAPSDRTVDHAMLATIYEEAGEAGHKFTPTYAEHKGTKEIAFTAWQRGHRRYAEKHGNG